MPGEEEAMKQPGNGSSRFNIDSDDMGGWVRVYSRGNPPDDLPVYLSLSLAPWFRDRPQLRRTCVVPTTRDGATVELHAWYECHVFPPAPEVPKPIQ
jgi:hypothetical protein